MPAVFRTRIMRDVEAEGEGNRDLVAGVSYVCRGPSRERGMSARRVPMTDDAVDDSDDPGPAGAGVERGRLDELRASARGWQGIQLAVLGFIGLCGVLQRGGRSIPRWIQILAGIAALVALGLALRGGISGRPRRVPATVDAAAMSRKTSRAPSDV